MGFIDLNAPTHIIGLMSGTSLDGLDIAHCTFSMKDGRIESRLNTAITYPYPSEIYNLLKKSTEFSGVELIEAHNYYGRYLGQQAISFLKKNKLSADYIASHGHTVFHQPNKKLTFQLGSGHEIAATTHKMVIADFRSFDVALGGQGAPLVPMGDKLLFSEYDACLNLGGFSNISILKTDNTIAFDICPVNIVLNAFSSRMGHPYDKDGRLAREGNLNIQLLHSLNNCRYYTSNGPKSLGFEWVQEVIYPLFKQADETPQNILRTFSKHIVDQIANVLSKYECRNVLVTGGGAHNKFLIETLIENTPCKIVIPPQLVADFKEAYIFALLGYLNLCHIPNTLTSVTGAAYDSIGGIIYGR